MSLWTLSRQRRKRRRAIARERRRHRHSWIGRHPRATLGLAVFLVMTPVWWSLGSSLASANTLPIQIQFVEWVRAHGGGSVVRWAENVWYSHHAPPKGGAPPKGAIPPPPKTASASGAARLAGGGGGGGGSGTSGPSHLPAPTNIVPVASPPLPGEGVWHAAGRTVDGIPTMYEAFLRVDPVHTSLVAGVVWMDPRLLRAQLYAGAVNPGVPGPWTPSSPITAPATSTLAAAFNSGFLMNASLGGFYLDGRQAVPLRTGAASLVIYKDGSATVGAWGTNVTMTSQVVAVRQNLSLLVNHGAPVPGLNANDTTVWGATLGNQVYVWRSGIGVTKDGALVYVGGPGLNITTLADLLARAGAVRAMELDINTDWVDFFTFNPPAGQPASPANGSALLSDMVRPDTRYFGPTNRDFFTMSVRSTPLQSTIAALPPTTGAAKTASVSSGSGSGTPRASATAAQGRAGTGSAGGRSPPSA